jgi:hypothetical protein
MLYAPCSLRVLCTRAKRAKKNIFIFFFSELGVLCVFAGESLLKLFCQALNRQESDEKVFAESARCVDRMHRGSGVAGGWS